jgi:simple sugar transport system ATP-binding protein
MLELAGIVKHFGGVTALDGIDLTVRRSEVVGLVGDNAAGKSTLIKAVAGAHQPDAGTIAFDGTEVRLGSPTEARRLGIETVYQNLALADNLDVASNIFLGREPLLRAGLPFVPRLVDRARMRRESEHLLDRLGISIASVRTLVRDLSGGQRQAVAISRAMLTTPKLVLLDEPTAALAVKEVERVLGLIEGLRSQGVAVILISHTLQHVLQVADRVVVLRRGRKVLEAAVADITVDMIVRAIVGGDLDPKEAVRA